jgi:hypothetical protein
MILHVLKHPDSLTLARVEQYDECDPRPLPDGYELMTWDDYRAWEAAELAAGWVPVEQQPAPSEQTVSVTAIRHAASGLGLSEEQVNALIEVAARQAEPAP